MCPECGPLTWFEEYLQLLKTIIMSENVLNPALPRDVAGPEVDLLPDQGGHLAAEGGPGGLQGRPLHCALQQLQAGGGGALQDTSLRIRSQTVEHPGSFVPH